jgi:hypothetical protein
MHGVTFGVPCIAFLSGVKIFFKKMLAGCGKIMYLCGAKK